MLNELGDSMTDDLATARAAKRPRLDESTTTPSSSLSSSDTATKDSSENYELKCTLKGHRKAISSIEFSPNGQWLVSACKFQSPLVSCATLLMTMVVQSWRHADTLALATFIPSLPLFQFAYFGNFSSLLFCRFDPFSFRLRRQDSSDMGNRSYFIPLS
jgi:WD40 repeat protein